MSVSRLAPIPSQTASARGWWFALFAVTLLAYYPALRAGFIWDDYPGHITRPELQSLAGLGRIWFEVGATQQYYPLLHSAFWLEHRLWGDAPFGYHLVNVLLHAFSACLVGTVLRRLGVPGAWLAAALFALHPVCVESVAWVSEQKNTLSTVFYLGAALVYLRFDAERGPRTYALATVLFLAALLSKTITATLPAALLVIAWWQRGRLEWRRDVVPLLPWFVLGLGAGVLTAWFEHKHIGAQGDAFTLGTLERGLLAGRAAWFYLGKLVWPTDLAFIYPRWTIDIGQTWQWLFTLAALALLGALWWRRTRTRGPLAATLFFGGTLFPALGFVNVFPFVYSYVADHFQYVACLGVLTLLAAGAATISVRFPPLARTSALLVLLGTLGALTWQQTQHYRDLFTLYTHTLAKNPTCWMAHNNLAIALVNADRAAEALPHYEAALKLRPGYGEAENNYGYALTKLGRPADALPHLLRAAELKPGYDGAQNNIGVALMALGRPAEGVVAFAEAARLNPKFALAHLNHGHALAANGRLEEAITPLRIATTLQPNYAEAHFFLAIALKRTGRDADAERHLEVALKLGYRPGSQSK